MSSSRPASESPAQASTTSPASTPSIPGKPTRILACQLCQSRKIKCDRKFPCANCTKANQECIPSKPAPARKRRRPNQVLDERLTRIESMLDEYKGPQLKLEGILLEDDRSTSAFAKLKRRDITCTGNDEGGLGEQGAWATANGSARHGSRSKAPAERDQAREAYQPLGHHGRLVDEAGGTRFMDSAILGTIYEELRAMREILNADENDGNTSDAVTADDDSEMVLGLDTPPGATPEELWPAGGMVFRLWQIYLDRVNPLTKIIHVPTLQPYVAMGASGCSGLTKPMEALLFSIWLMAAVSLSQEECQTLLGYSRDTALQRFSTGVRMALGAAHFLSSNEMTTLQALVIYLISLQGRYNRHAAWILNGVVIRIAQKMGLHRDGEKLGLGPFDSEMRRRLWWQIIMLDAKYAMMTGLNHSLLPRAWDTKEPKNLNDVDMFPSAKEPFQDREGPTEMIFVMITNTVAKFLVQTPGLEFMLMLSEWSGTPSTVNPRLNEVRNGIAQLGQDLLDMLNRYCDPTAGPVHRMAVEIRSQIIKRLNALAVPPKEQPEWGDEIRDTKDNAFKLAICAMEHEQETCAASRDNGFLWHSLLHFQLEVFVYLAGQLCHRSEGALVERAWKQVEAVYHYHQELYEMRNNKTNFMLARFILKAWSKRADVLYRKTGHIPVTPLYITKLQSLMPLEDFKSEAPSNTVQPGADLMIGNPLYDPDPAVDQLLAGGFLDAGAGLDWDMYAGLPVALQTDVPSSIYMTSDHFNGYPPR